MILAMNFSEDVEGIAHHIQGQTEHATNMIPDQGRCYSKTRSMMQYETHL